MVGVPRSYNAEISNFHSGIVGFLGSHSMSHIRVVGTVIRLRARQPRNCVSTPYRSKRFFNAPEFSDRLWGPPCLLLNEYPRALSLEVKRSELESDHSPVLVPKFGAEFLFNRVP